MLTEQKEQENDYECIARNSYSIDSYIDSIRFNTIQYEQKIRHSCRNTNSNYVSNYGSLNELPSGLFI